jgi:hypothetical protein
LKKIVTLFVTAPFFSISLDGQSLLRSNSFGYPGLAAYSVKQADVFSFPANQAALAQLKNTAAGLYGEKYYLLNELNKYTAVAGITTRSGNFGCKAGYAGFTGYNESVLGIAYGKKLGSKADIGIAVNYLRTAISSGYGQAAVISVEAGTIFHLSEKLNAGFHLANPAGGKFGVDKQDKLAARYTMGFGYDASDKFFISTTIEKEENQPVNINAGFQYLFIPRLFMRMGLSSATGTGWWGIAFILHSFRLDVTVSSHPQLGLSPAILLLFDFNKNTKRRK